MSDTSEIFRGMRTEQRKRRSKRLPIRAREILTLREDGFKVEQITAHQFRVNDRLDLYPVHNLFHDIISNRRGAYHRAPWFVQHYFQRLKKDEHNHKA